MQLLVAVIHGGRAQAGTTTLLHLLKLYNACGATGQHVPFVVRMAPLPPCVWVTRESHATQRDWFCLEAKASLHSLPLPCMGACWVAPSPELEEAPLSAGAGQVREDRAEAAFVLLSPGSSFPCSLGSFPVHSSYLGLSSSLPSPREVIFVLSPEATELPKHLSTFPTSMLAEY